MSAASESTKLNIKYFESEDGEGIRQSEGIELWKGDSKGYRIGMYRRIRCQ